MVVRYRVFAGGWRRERSTEKMWGRFCMLEVQEASLGDGLSKAVELRHDGIDCILTQSRVTGIRRI